MTSESFETFMNLICSQPISKKNDLFKLIFDTFYYKISKKSVVALHTPEHTLLRKLHDSKWFPFDPVCSDRHSCGSTAKGALEASKQSKEFVKQRSPLPYRARRYSGSKATEFHIDLLTQTTVRELRLLFGPSQGKPYKLNVKVFGYMDASEVLLFAETYQEALHCYLTQN
mmetsp:Transcript_41236/g.47501  ORF Transcript_41236/g.47501 Transcript_41236/m.47501 type:complete len:171 (-) Transcript_41236:114-626(-)